MSPKSRGCRLVVTNQKKQAPGFQIGPVPVKWILKNNNATVSWIYHQVDLTGDFLRCLIVFLVV